MAFKHISQVADEAEKYIDNRRKGLIRSCKTGGKKLDKALLGGIEWGSVVGIGGRPSVGKTAYSSCLIRGILQNNPLDDIEIRDFNWEMSGRSLIIRDLSAETGKTYGDILSVNEEAKVSDEQMQVFREVFDKYRKFPWYMEEEPKSTKEFKDIIRRIMKANPSKKTVVRIDHSILAKQAADEASQVIMLQNLLNACVELKKEGDIIFIILTQLVRTFEDRQQDGMDEAYPRQSDTFGGDAIAQSCDTVILLNRPSKYGITFYGKRPGGVVIEFPDTIFAHVVKSRNSVPDLVLIYRAQFDKMKMTEL